MDQEIDIDQVSTWTVIQFIDDSTVEAVPSTWIQGDLCHWPSFAKSKLLSAIRKCEPLNTCWSTHKVKLFRNATFDDYMTARNKAKIAEETSDLNSASESSGFKRKRIQKILSSSDDSTLNESQLSSPPKIRKFKSKAKEKENRNIKPNGEPRDKKTEQLLERNVLIESSTQQEPSSKFDSLDINTMTNDRIIQLPCHKCNEKDRNFQTIIEQNHILRGLMTDTLSEVKEIKRLLRQSKLTQIQDNPKKDKFFKSPGINFPINTDEEFERLENLLQNEEELKNAVEELSRLGGSSAYDLIKRILTLTLTNDQTIKYSWLGRKGKRIFNNLSIAKVLIRSVQLAGLEKSIKETEIAIQAWLRRASDRRSNTSKKF